MPKKKLAINTISSLIYQFIAIVCGFILPRFILNYYGSAVNGLVSSVNQFLNVITFLEMGMGAVVQTSLYRPLFQKNHDEISCIWVSANKFFRRIATVLFFYVIILVAVYPLVINDSFDYWYTGTLIIAISISLFAQYFFGIVNQLLLNADQRGYIHYVLQIGTYVVNILTSVLLISHGASIQIVKLTTSLIFFVRPIILSFYVHKKYKINRRISYTEEPIKQKWNGVAQHVSSVVLDGTDTIVLSMFSTLENVSIYAVYHLVTYGVKTLFMSMTNGIQALLGEIVARGQDEQIRKYYMWVEWVVHTAVIFVFGCTAVLIVPFVRVYTAGISDVEYVVPLFAALITIANGLHCLRIPYHMMVKAYGKYRETQNNYFITAMINIIISIIMVKSFGLIGVAIGTLAAMTFQTIWMAWYNSKNLVKGEFLGFLKQIFVDGITAVMATVICRLFSQGEITYISWVMLAIKMVLTWGVVIVLVNIFFFPDKVKAVVKRFIK